MKFIERMGVGFGVEKQLFRSEYLKSMLEYVEYLDSKKLKLYKQTAKKSKFKEEIKKAINELKI